MELYEKTVHELKQLMAAGEVSVLEILQSFFHRIQAVEEDISAFITLTPDEAHRCLKEKNAEGSLGGIPVAVKDNISTAGIRTTCGSRTLENYYPPYNATVIKKLQAAGALLMGKTNMDEFAMGSSTENTYFFTTRNPWDLERVPGGSSGGSAAAVAAREVPLAFGSDTGGSIRQPASFCGVVGMKPTYGFVSRYGLLAYASSLDQIGPLTQDVRDAALALGVICGHDPLDSTSIQRDVPNFLGALEEEIKGIIIGVPREFFQQGVQGEIKRQVYQAIKGMESFGAQIEEVSLPHMEYALPAYYLIAPAESSSNLARYDGIQYGYRTSQAGDLMDFYQKTRQEGFGDEVKRRIMLGTYALSSGYYDAYYLKALKVRRLIKEDFDKVFAHCHVLMTPTTPTTAFKQGEKIHDILAMYMTDICTVPVNLAGLPGISIPCGFDEKGLPVGLQIIGDAFSEETILQVAYHCEMSLNLQRRPQLKRR